MADHYSGGAISLSQPQGIGLSRNSDDDQSSDHSPPTLSGNASGGGGNRMRTRRLISPSSAEIMSMSSKRPRGRPPGSKNKPKAPIVITKDSDSAMKTVVLEISAGSDVVETVVQYAQRCHVGISVLSGSGTVSNVTLRHPAGSHAPALSFHGPFNLLSLSGSFMDAPSSSAATSSFLACASFGICLAGTQGHVFGGIVGGKVVAATAVLLVAATFLDPMVLRLPISPSYHDHHHHQGCDNGGGGGDSGDYEAQEETKPCINEINSSLNYSSGGGGGSGVGNPTAVNCQMSSPPQQHQQEVTPWGAPSRPHPY